MTQFTVLREGEEVAEVEVEDKHITVAPRNILSNLSLVTNFSPFGGFLGALKDSGYEVTVKLGPFKFSLGK